MLELTLKPFTNRIRQLFADEHCTVYEDHVIIRDHTRPGHAVVVNRDGDNLFCQITGDWVGKLLGVFPQDIEHEEEQLRLKGLK